MHRPGNSHQRAALITEAPVNANDEYDHRRKRYLVMMTIRAACIVGAACTFHVSGWLAAAFVAAAAVLPWAAVLIANDRPPKKEVQFRRFLGASGWRHPRQLIAGTVGATSEPAAGADDPRAAGDAAEAPATVATEGRELPPGSRPQAS